MPRILRMLLNLRVKKFLSASSAKTYLAWDSISFPISQLGHVKTHRTRSLTINSLSPFSEGGGREGFANRLVFRALTRPFLSKINPDFYIISQFIFRQLCNSTSSSHLPVSPRSASIQFQWKSSKKRRKEGEEGI